MRARPVSLRDLFLAWLRVGVVGFGGGASMLLVVEREVVERRAWVPDEEFVEVTALAQILPGVIIVNVATLLGHRMRGGWGAIVSAVGVTLPAFLAVLAIAYLYVEVRSLAFVERIFAGIAGAAVALLLALVVGVGRLVLRDWRDVAIAAGAVVAVAGLRLHPVPVLLAGAGVGLLLRRR